MKNTYGLCYNHFFKLNYMYLGLLLTLMSKCTAKSGRKICRA